MSESFSFLFLRNEMGSFQTSDEESCHLKRNGAV